jgi:hypothetical protein
MTPAQGGGNGGRTKRPTMVDVAREARVALRTVSRVVNNDPTVGPDYVVKVRAAIAALKFRPDERARRLRSGVTGTIGAAVRRVAEANPTLAAIEQTARAAGLTLLTSSTDFDEARERDVLVSMCRQRLDGIIVEPIGKSHGYLEPELEAGVPVVAIDRPMSGVSVDCVMSDNAFGIGMAFHHLHQHGHRRIAYIGDSERVFSGRERAAAFRAALVAHGQPVEGRYTPATSPPSGSPQRWTRCCTARIPQQRSSPATRHHHRRPAPAGAAGGLPTGDRRLDEVPPLTRCSPPSPVAQDNAKIAERPSSCCARIADPPERCRRWSSRLP